MLADRDGNRMIDQIVFAEQTADLSFGRSPDGSDNWITMDPSPGGPNVTLAVDPTVEQVVPQSFALHQNFPNPFNPTTTIRFDLAEPVHARLTVYDIAGRTVAELVNRELTVGEHAVEWNAQSSASGIYFYRISAGAFTEVKKMALIR
jgi:hypothetical protein